MNLRSLDIVIIGRVFPDGRHGRPLGVAARGQGHEWLLFRQQIAACGTCWNLRRVGHVDISGTMWLVYICSSMG